MAIFTETLFFNQQAQKQINIELTLLAWFCGYCIIRYDKERPTNHLTY